MFRSPLKKSLLVLMAVGLMAAGAVVPAESPAYQVGGRMPLGKDIQHRLDAESSRIRLGINTDRLMEAGLKPEPYVECVLRLAEAVEDGELPGVVFHMDSFWGDNLPIGIGNRLLEPEVRETDWSAYYEAGELTGPVIVTPLVLRALERNDLRLESRVGDFVPELKGSAVGDLTVYSLLRHTSGLPSAAGLPGGVRERPDLMRFLASMETGKSVRNEVVRSGLNYLLLGLVIEGLYGIPVQQLAREHYIEPLGMVNTVSDLPDQLRSRCAPGEYSTWHRRLVWGEAADPAAYVLGSSAGNGGMITSPDDLGIFARAMLVTYTAGIDDLMTSETMHFSVQPCQITEGGGDQGLGWALNALGPGSFGWEGPDGCAMWIQPRARVFLIVLANPAHPDGKRAAFRKTLRDVYALAREAIVIPEDQVWMPEPSLPCDDLAEQMRKANKAMSIGVASEP